MTQLVGHKDSVTSVGFSHDGVYAASADLGGLIKVWKVDTGKEVWSFECSDIEVHNTVYWHHLACWSCSDKKAKKLHHKIITCTTESKP